MPTSRTPSPNRTDNNLEKRRKLEAYRVLVDKGKTLPDELAEHIESVIFAPRDASITPSPNAKKISQRRRLAAQQNEKTGVGHLEPYMLFHGEAELEDKVPGVPLIMSKAELNLSSFFAPSVPAAKDIYGNFSQPRPDICIGYVTRSDVASAELDDSAAPFTAEEEQILDGFCLTQYMYLPFLTSQWKAPHAETLYVAQNQAARDGAVLVNYLHDFYTTAYDRAPSLVETAHFSFQCDMTHGEIWVHWREESTKDGQATHTHHMELVHEFSLRQENQIREARGILHNILSYSVGTRLQSIKDALPAFARNRSLGRGPVLPKVAQSATAGSEGWDAPSEVSSSDAHSTTSWVNVRFAIPMTPSSVASEPVKKRPRLDDDSGFEGSL